MKKLILIALLILGSIANAQVQIEVFDDRGQLLNTYTAEGKVTWTESVNKDYILYKRTVVNEVMEFKIANTISVFDSKLGRNYEVIVEDNIFLITFWKGSSRVTYTYEDGSYLDFSGNTRYNIYYSH